MHPDKIKNIITDTSLLVKDVVFTNKSYDDVQIENNSIIYLDPPYFNSSVLYNGNINKEDFYNYLGYLNKLDNVSYYLSLDGINKSDKTQFDLPKELYTEHVYLNSGVSSWNKLYKENINVKESLYYKQ